VKKFIWIALVCSPALVLAQTNVAASSAGAVASQSSDWSGTPASRANDGNRNGNWSANSVSHTNHELNAWWQSSFASASVIDEVLVFNRTDGLENRINPFSVYLYNGIDLVWSSTGNTFTPDITATNISGMTFDVPDVLADRVKIQLDGSNYLHMGEVEAWNTAVPEPASMLALGAGALALLRKRRKSSK
jgi:F5/8 type C domain/PEP-CTERM motif